jgi:hypothetical protein
VFLASDPILAEPVTDSVATLGKTPLDIQMRAGDPAGAAFQTAFVINTYVIPFQSVDICRAEIKAGLILALFGTFLSVDYAEMAFFIHLKTIKE